jgi:hypothetical protein
MRPNRAQTHLTAVQYLQRASMPKQTAVIAKPIDLNGRPYQRRAFEALPILVRQATAGQTIYYSDIAAELGITNPRIMNFILGSVGTSLRQLADAWHRAIPPIQGLVIAKGTKLPGEGFFTELASTAATFKRAPLRIKRQIVDGLLAGIYAFPDWEAVLQHFGMEPLAPPNLEDLLPMDVRIALGACGESQAHAAFKRYIADNPQIVGVSELVESAQLEHRFPSSDSVDVLFTTKFERVAVEVKSALSADEDLLRGLFQCVKYRALLEGVLAVEQSPMDSRVILALQAELPPHLRSIANTLGIPVFDKLDG